MLKIVCETVLACMIDCLGTCALMSLNVLLAYLVFNFCIGFYCYIMVFWGDDYDCVNGRIAPSALI